MKRTLILGASSNPTRYSNLATHRLLSHGHEVVLFGNKAGEVAGQVIHTSTETLKGEIHTVTIYLSANNQIEYEEFIIDLKPKRVIFNPGAENPTFEAKLKKAGINYEDACTLVLLASGQY